MEKNYEKTWSRLLKTVWEQELGYPLQEIYY